LAKSGNWIGAKVLGTLAIETQGLVKRFGRQVAVNRLDLKVPQQSVFGFLGPNGAGKSTTMRMLLGLTTPDEGRISIFGRDLKSNRIATLSEIGATIEAPALYDHASGWLNVDLTRRLRGLKRAETDRVLEVVGLTPVGAKRVSGYSMGMRQRLALARALLGEPKLLILDEPTNGLDPEGIEDMRALLSDLPHRTGVTVFVSSHLLSEVEHVATSVGLIYEGRLILQGEVRSLLSAQTRVVFQVNNPAQAKAIVLARGIADVIAHADTIDMLVEQERRGIAAINRALVEGGLEVSAVSVQVRTLEKLYRDTLSTRSEGALL
jgi:lantibiotic transport system ATP-binding protein